MNGRKYGSYSNASVLSVSGFASILLTTSHLARAGTCLSRAGSECSTDTHVADQKLSALSQAISYRLKWPDNVCSDGPGVKTLDR